MSKHTLAQSNEQVQAVVYRMEMGRHFAEKAEAAAKACRAYRYGLAVGANGCAEHQQAQRDLGVNTRLASAWFDEANEYAAGL